MPMHVLYLYFNEWFYFSFGCGPLLIAKDQINEDASIETYVIPGALTTAHFLLNLAYPGIKNKKALLFQK